MLWTSVAVSVTHDTSSHAQMTEYSNWAVGTFMVYLVVWLWFIRNPEYFVPPALDDSQHAWHHSDEDLIKMILEGSPRTKQMPSWKKLLSKRDAADLVAYMKSLWGSRALECQGPKHMSCLRK